MPTELHPVDLRAYCESRHPQVIVLPGANPSCGPGWNSILTAAVDRMAAVMASRPGSSILLEQVKQKFGTLRIYWHGKAMTRRQHRRIDIIVSLAEERSGCVCERCGSRGYIREPETGFAHTACDAHSEDPPEDGKMPREFMVTRPISRKRRISEAMTYDFEKDRLVVLSRRTETSSHWKHKR